MSELHSADQANTDGGDSSVSGCKIAAAGVDRSSQVTEHRSASHDLSSTQMPERFERTPVIRMSKLLLEPRRANGTSPESVKLALWKNHESYNHAVKTAGDWILTLRGGIDHRLASALPIETKSGIRPPEHGEIADRRRLLALSWLSVESAAGASGDYVVAHSTDTESKTRSDWQTVAALRQILHDRGVDAAEIETWVEDCRPTLEAPIHPDGVWVNRAAIFAQHSRDSGDQLTHELVWDLLGQFFGTPEQYLLPLNAVSSSELEHRERQSEITGEATVATDETEKALSSDDGAARMRSAAETWLSRRFPAEGAAAANFDLLAEKHARLAAAIASVVASRGDAGVGGLSGTELIGQIAEQFSSSLPPERAFSTDAAKAISSLTRLIEFLSDVGQSGSAVIRLLRQVFKTAVVDNEIFDKLVEAVELRIEKCRTAIRRQEMPYAKAIVDSIAAESGIILDPKAKVSNKDPYGAIFAEAAAAISALISKQRQNEIRRQQFEVGARKRSALPVAACDWLDSYCNQESTRSASRWGYAIRSEAISNWSDVVAAWTVAGANTEGTRIEIVREIQGRTKRKMGDADLFMALAADAAASVWRRPDGTPDATILKRYVEVTTAAQKAAETKTPIFRHPDPILSPRHCPFGPSHFRVQFDTLPMTQGRKTRSLAPKIEPEHRQVRLGLAGSDGEPVVMRWVSKRFSEELHLPALLAKSISESEPHPPTALSMVSRDTRLARRAASVTADQEVGVTGLLDKTSWFGKLMLSREDRAKLVELTHRDGISAEERERRQTKVLKYAKWHIQVCVHLIPDGPFYRYLERNGFHPAADQPLKLNRYFHAEVNKGRGSEAKLRLQRLPAGLRTMTVRFGRDSAAQCAVVQTVSEADIIAECQRAQVEPPGAEAIHFALRTADGKLLRYRRVAPSIIEGTQHPSPWLRVDRQFHLRLEGEKRQHRNIDENSAAGRATNRSERTRRSFAEEARFVRDMLDELGVKNSYTVQGQVIDLQSQLLGTTRLALARHSRAAKIAFNLNTTTPLPDELKDAERDYRVKFIARALGTWAGLAKSDEWQAPEIRHYWDDKIKPLLNGVALEDITPRKWKGLMTAAAVQLLDQPAEAAALSQWWTTRWQGADPAWQQRLRSIKAWIMGRQRFTDGDHRSFGRAGGLSLERLRNLNDLRRILVSYETRSTPAAIKGKQIASDFASDLMRKLDRLQAQRHRELVGQIVEAAAGLGERTQGRDVRRTQAVDDPRFAACDVVIVEARGNNGQLRSGNFRAQNRDIAQLGRYALVQALKESVELHGIRFEERYPPKTEIDSVTGRAGTRCAAVPIYDLVTPGRYWNIDVQHALARTQKVADGEESGRLADHQKVSARDRYLSLLAERWDPERRVWVDIDGSRWMLDKHGNRWNLLDARTAGDRRQAPQSVIIPKEGGTIFVSSDPESPMALGDDALLNEVLNLGIAAFTDPDSPLAWSVILANRVTQVPLRKSTVGSLAVPTGQSLPVDPECLPVSNDATALIEEDGATAIKKPGRPRAKTSQTDNRYLCRERSTAELTSGAWVDLSTFKRRADEAVIARLQQRYGLGSSVSVTGAGEFSGNAENV